MNFMLRIYLASSWKNPYFDSVVDVLRSYGFIVYNFKDTGFSWFVVAPEWEMWTQQQFIYALDEPIPNIAYNIDYSALHSSDICILLLPSGASAHTEAGYMKGLGKKVYVLALGSIRPELLYKIYDGIYTSLNALIVALIG